MMSWTMAIFFYEQSLFPIRDVEFLSHIPTHSLHVIIHHSQRSSRHIVQCRRLLILLQASSIRDSNTKNEHPISQGALKQQ